MPEKEKEKEKKKKKQLIKVQGLPDSESGGGYSYRTMHYAFVSNPAEGRKQCTSTMTCREYVNSSVYKSVNNLTGTDLPPVDFTRLRLLMARDPNDLAKFKSKLFNAKAVLNLYERNAGWKPSTITTVNHSAYKNAWLLTGPQQWMSQPQLLSMATFIMRFISNNGPIDVSNLNAAETSMKRLLDDYMEKKKEASKREYHSFEHDGDIESFLSRFWDKMYVLVKFADEIFAGVGHDTAWVKPGKDSFGVVSGFQTFVDGKATYTSEVKNAAKKFKKLCSKHLPRKEVRA